MFLMEEQGLLDGPGGQRRVGVVSGDEGAHPLLAQLLAQVADGARAEVKCAGNRGRREALLEAGVNALPHPGS
jgi:hypothetical protein